MQAVADAHLLYVANPGVERGQHVGAGLCVDIGEQARFRRTRDNGLRQPPGARRVDAGGAGIFVEQRLNLRRGAMHAGRCQRRRQMAERDSAEAPARLRRLARVVDDERIDDRHCASHNLGRALGVQRHGFAGQPLKCAMRAAVNHCVDFGDAAKPEIESDVTVARRQIGVVVAVAARRAAGAVRLQGNGDIAVLQNAKDKAALQIKHGVSVRRAPRGSDRLNEAGRQRIEILPEVGERHHRPDVMRHALHQRCVVNVIQRRASKPCIRQVARNRLDARRRVEADGIAGAPAFRGIVRHHQRKSARAARRPAQPRPVGREVGDETDARCLGRMRQPRKLRVLIERQRRLERDRPRDNAAVNLRQHDMHGEVGGAEAAL